MKIESPLIVKLQKELSEKNAGAMQLFWDYVTTSGTPLIESQEGQKDLLVTFLYPQKEQDNPPLLLFGTPANFDALNHQFVHLPGSDLWFLTLVLPPELRTIYGILPSAPHLPSDFPDHPDFELLTQFFSALLNQIKADPFNHFGYTIPPGIWLNSQEIHLSRLELPLAPSQPWVQYHAEVPKGSVTKVRFKSHLLGNERNVWIYVPAHLSNNERNDCCYFSMAMPIQASWRRLPYSII